MENSLALGGMRNPHSSLSKIPGARGAGLRIRQVLNDSLRRHPSFAASIASALEGHPMSEPSEDLLTDARAGVCSLLGSVMNDWSPGLCSQVFSTYLELSGDPDDCLPIWLRDGAPLGINRAVSHRGVFPPVPDRITDPGYLSGLVLGPSGWTNYRSAEEEPGLTQDLLEAMVARQWADRYDSWEHVEATLGTSEVILNRLALISKRKADGTFKHRLVWDLRRSGVNAAVKQGSASCSRDSPT